MAKNKDKSTDSTDNFEKFKSKSKKDKKRKFKNKRLSKDQIEEQKWN
jgi:hypothetical protein